MHISIVRCFKIIGGRLKEYAYKICSKTHILTV